MLALTPPTSQWTLKTRALDSHVALSQANKLNITGCPWLYGESRGRICSARTGITYSFALDQPTQHRGYFDQVRDARQLVDGKTTNSLSVGCDNTRGYSEYGAMRTDLPEPSTSKDDRPGTGHVTSIAKVHHILRLTLASTVDG